MATLKYAPFGDAATGEGRATLDGWKRYAKTIAMFAVAGAFAYHHIAAREDPVEVRVVVDDPLEGAAHVPEQLADLVGAIGQAPLREVDLGVGGESFHQPQEPMEVHVVQGGLDDDLKNRKPAPITRD